MTETLTLAVALFVTATTATLALTAVFAPDPTVRGRAQRLLHQLLRGRKPG